MGMYLITNVMCFYDFQISNGFVATTNAKYENIYIYIYIMIISSITKSVRLVEIEEFSHTN